MDKLNSLFAVLKKIGLGGFIVVNPVNIFYLTGFKGVSQTERESILVLTKTKAALITARLYQNEARKLKTKKLEIVIVDERNQINKRIQQFFSQTKKVGFEANDLKFAEYKLFNKLLKNSKLVPTKNLIEDIRVIKTKEEITNIEKAQKISQKAHDMLIKTISSGQAETEIAEKLERIIKNLGGQGLAFETIIASGPNSALPHHVTGKRKIKKGDIILFDFGAKYNHYCADLTRTIFLGKAKDEHKNIYEHVQKTQKKTIKLISHNIASHKPFHATNTYFKAQKLHKHFLHSLGHGIGLEVHEKPSLSKKSKDRLKESMVFSIEPGLYFPNWGGVRIEDLVTIKNGRAKVIGTQAKFIEI